MPIQVRSNEKPQTPPQAEVGTQGRVSDNPKQEGKENSLEATKTLSALDTKVSEQKEHSESETEGDVSEAKKDDETEEQGDKETGKKKGGFQRRIDKLSAQRAQAQQELEYWKQLALKNAGSSKSEAEVNSKSENHTPPSSNGKPSPDSFETHTEYVEALTDWKTEQKLKEREQRAARERIDQEQSKIVATYTERMKSFSSQTPDFQDVLSDVDHIPLSVTLREIILSSENGPELAYELAKTPGEYERIAKLSPTACAREIGKFEARLNASKVSHEKTEKKITKAPKPIEPLGSGGKGSVSKSIFDSTLSQADYEALRREQMKQRRQA